MPAWFWSRNRAWSKEKKHFWNQIAFLNHFIFSDKILNHCIFSRGWGQKKKKKCLDFIFLISTSTLMSAVMGFRKYSNAFVRIRVSMGFHCILCCLGDCTDTRVFTGHSTRNKRWDSECGEESILLFREDKRAHLQSGCMNNVQMMWNRDGLVSDAADLSQNPHVRT